MYQNVAIETTLNRSFKTTLNPDWRPGPSVRLGFKVGDLVESRSSFCEVTALSINPPYTQWYTMAFTDPMPV